MVVVVSCLFVFCLFCFILLFLFVFYWGGGGGGFALSSLYDQPDSFGRRGFARTVETGDASSPQALIG